MIEEVYKLLADRLNTLPNGFPPTTDEVELRILAKLFTQDEAYIASNLRLTLETADQICERIGCNPEDTLKILKGMSRKGLINAGRTADGLGFGLLPFVVGIYEMQVGNIDEELAYLFDAYYKQVFASTMQIQPTFHRVIPVNTSVEMDLEIKPYESVAEIVAQAEAWGILDCICRKQKMLVGDPCNHPIDVCMAFSNRPGAFNNTHNIKAVSLDEALVTLERAAKAGLVHSVSNIQEEISYICNCCTCSCGILRGMAEMGLGSVIARSAFVNNVNEDLCLGCEDCLDYCQFSALTVNVVVMIDQLRCVGCGVCVSVCPEDALYLTRRPIEDVSLPPVTHSEWLKERANARGIDIDSIL